MKISNSSLAESTSRRRVTDNYCNIDEGKYFGFKTKNLVKKFYHQRIEKKQRKLLIPITLRRNLNRHRINNEIQ